MDTEFSKSEAPLKGVHHPHSDGGGATGILGTSSNKNSSSKASNTPAGVWKVGRLSMGLFLVLLGGVTFASKFWGSGHSGPGVNLVACRFCFAGIGNFNVYCLERDA